MIAAARAAVGNPFPGLRPFRESERHLFFGRESKLDRMVDKLAAQRFLAVVGSSGAGKSSLVNCGLKPALRRGLLASAGTSWRMAQFRPGNNPNRALAIALAQEAGLFSQLSAALRPEDMIEATLRLSGVGLVDICHQARLDPDVNLLVMVDQFEELFRYRSMSGSDAYGFGPESIRFVRLLLEAAAQREVPIYVALTMRSDFLGDCDNFDGLPDAISEGQYLVPRMTRDERRLAVEGPIGVAECTISSALLTRLVNDVGDNPDQLSILQHALRRTWAHWHGEGHGQGPVSLKHYEAVGTMAEALDRHAEKAFHELITDRQKQVCERVFKALTDRGTDARGVRRPTQLAKLCEIVDATPDEIGDVIRVFRKPSRSFLFPEQAEKVGPDTVIDISHESLMRIWNRLKRWADEEAESAREYRRLSDRADGFFAKRFGLMKDPDLQTALDFQARQQPTEGWANIYGGGFGPALDFLKQSKKHRDLEAAEQELERRWQTYWKPLVFGASALGFLIVLFKFHSSLLPPTSDLPGYALRHDAGKLLDLGMRFAALSAITLAFALLYNFVTRRGQKIHRRLILPSILANIGNPPKTAASVREPVADPAIANGTMYARWWQRGLALVIDAAVGFLFFTILAVLASARGNRGSGSKDEVLWAYPLLFACVCIYQSLMVGSRLQASLGMRALRIYVTDTNGAPLSRFRVMGRQVVKLLCYGSTLYLMVPFEALVRMALYLAGKRLYQKQKYLRRRQWLGDIASRTVMLVRPPKTPLG
jgi:uncharacterized RDD family membrane protein YckC